MTEESTVNAEIPEPEYDEEGRIVYQVLNDRGASLGARSGTQVGCFAVRSGDEDDTDECGRFVVDHWMSGLRVAVARTFAVAMQIADEVSAAAGPQAETTGTPPQALSAWIDQCMHDPAGDVITLDHCPRFRDWQRSSAS